MNGHLNVLQIGTAKTALPKKFGALNGRLELVTVFSKIGQPSLFVAGNLDVQYKLQLSYLLHKLDGFYIGLLQTEL